MIFCRDSCDALHSRDKTLKILTNLYNKIATQTAYFTIQIYRMDLFLFEHNRKLRFDRSLCPNLMTFQNQDFTFFKCVCTAYRRPEIALSTKCRELWESGSKCLASVGMQNRRIWCKMIAPLLNCE